MNKDKLSNNWNQSKIKIKEKWNKLTDDDIQCIEGRRDLLMEKIKKRYGYSKDEAEKEIKSWEDHNKNCNW
ncbi:MAG: CsbD family protein [Pantoea sp. Brub]|nr:CsbD family protein [Pantoea sp. Brub]